METISVRIGDMKSVDEFTTLLQENRSETIRELLKEGKRMKALELYKNKKISLGLGARLAGLPLSEFMDLLQEFAVSFNVEKDDAIQSLQYAREIL
jgi:predicted HTH domain antitoxin